MNIKQSFEGDKLVLFLEGNFDESTGASVESVFLEALDKDCQDGQEGGPREHA